MMHGTQGSTAARIAADADGLVDELKEDGICVLRDAIPRAVIDEWAAAFRELFERRMRMPGGVAPREQHRYYMTLPWIRPFAEESVFAHPIVLDVIRRTFANDFRMVQLATDTPLRGSTYQEIHRDFNPLFGDTHETPLYALAVNFPLVDVDENNGPFQMARGTHRMSRVSGLEKIAKGELELETFSLRKGDVMIRSPLALHRGSPNLTDTPRPMVVMGYTLSWLNTENLSMEVPRDYYETLPDDVRRMLRCRVVDQVDGFRPETYLEFKY